MALTKEEKDRHIRTLAYIHIHISRRAYPHADTVYVDASLCLFLSLCGSAWASRADTQRDLSE